MLSSDQRAWLDYRSPGLLADVQAAYAVLPWLDVEVGGTGGVFLSHAVGGLAAPMLGALARLSSTDVIPYVYLDLGVGFTGTLVRPFGRLGGGLEFVLSRTLRAGPSLGLGVVTAQGGVGYSTDAIYASLGLSLTYWPAAAPAPLRQAAHDVPLPVPAPPPLRAAVPEPSPSVSQPLPAAHEPAPPSPALDALLDRALPTQQTELLAPVLFALDSDELDANGVAMLHEVVRVLNDQRSDIVLLEIAAYADARGSPEHNLELAQKRAQRVRRWLVEHGVAAERLQVSARGAVDFVEPGATEAEHQQNRRVVFRVLRTRQP